MGRKSLESLRRSELSDAAFDVLMKHGIRGTTLEKVAAEAGLSKGVVLHYFDDRDALFETVMRRANSVLRTGVVSLLRQARNPWERVYAVIFGNFAPTVFRQEVCNGWICLCAEVPYNAQFKRIQNVIYTRMISNLMDALAVNLGRDQAYRIARDIRTTIDGVWLRQSFGMEQIDRQAALNEVFFSVDSVFLSHPEFDEARHVARERMEMVSQIVFSSQDAA